MRPRGGLHVNGAVSGQAAELDGANALANYIRKVLQHGRKSEGHLVVAQSQQAPHSQ